MNENVNHIISRFSWDTSFDEKGRAFELQERLSGWSRIKMPKEVARVFDKICPPEQTWKIKSLEIDLGEVDYNNLEFELTTRLCSQLNEKLTDLIIYASPGDTNVELLTEDKSHVQMISSFLLQGLLPWNYKAADGSVNQMLAYQLQNNRRNIIAMLKEAGVSHADVRKRMAWQIDEANLLKIIEGFEPNNHGQIISFSDELTKIQSKKTIVKTSTADFKKNVWLWVLNYLLTERGTVFNKVAYMRSTLTQMASHYNIHYDELLELIDLAVYEMDAAAVKADFVLTLKLLSQENENDRRKTWPKDENNIDFWHQLECYFKGEPLQIPGSQKTDFNELVISLSDSDRPRFFKLILSLGDTGDLWPAIIPNLNDASLGAICSVLNETRSATVIDSIHLLDTIGKETELSIDRNILWQAVLQFLSEHKNSSFDNREFLEYCITEISTKKGIKKARMLDALIGARVPSTARDIPSLEIYADLTNVFINEVVRANAVFTESHFKGLINLFGVKFSSSPIDKKAFLSLQRSIVKNMEANPNAAFQYLITYPDKEHLQKLIPYLINDRTAYLLMKYADREILSATASIQQIINELKASKTNNKLAALIDENLMLSALNATIFHSDIKGIKLFEFILKELAGGIPMSEWEQFETIINKLTTNHGPGLKGISTAVVNSLKEERRKAGKQPALKTGNVRRIKFIEKRKNGTEILPGSSGAMDESLLENKPSVPIGDDGREENITMEINETVNVARGELLKAERKALLDELIYDVLCQNQVPVWLDSSGYIDTSELLRDIAVHYPVKLKQLLGDTLIAEQQMQRLYQTMSFKEICRAIGQTNRTRQPLLDILEKFYFGLRNILANGISSKEIQYILFKKLINAWTSNNWRTVSTENIWNELIWDACVKRGIPKKELLLQLERGKSYFPPALQISLGYLKGQSGSSRGVSHTAILSKPTEQLLQKKYAPAVIKGGIPVRNAGVVLVNNYIFMLFERLGILQDGQFINKDAQADAAHYLQYVVTGLTRTEESYLPLNKILCGLPLSHPVRDGIDISETHKKLIEGLLESMIGHWPEIGHCTADGFRGNWLVRGGLLLEHEDKWELVVEKRPYDILMNTSPFSFSIIKYLWTQKPLHVSWNY